MATYHYRYTPNFAIHSSINGHLGGFLLLPFVNIAVMNMVVKISVRVPVFSYFEYIWRSGIPGLYGSSIFNFLRNLHTISLFSQHLRLHFFPVFFLDCSHVHGWGSTSM